jgi:hypothetical protein
MKVPRAAIGVTQGLGAASGWMVIHDFKSANFECDSWDGSATWASAGIVDSVDFNATCDGKTATGTATITD